MYTIFRERSSSRKKAPNSLNILEPWSYTLQTENKQFSQALKTREGKCHVRVQQGPANISGTSCWIWWHCQGTRKWCKQGKPAAASRSSSEPRALAKFVGSGPGLRARHHTACQGWFSRALGLGQAGLWRTLREILQHYWDREWLAMAGLKWSPGPWEKNWANSQRK